MEKICNNCEYWTEDDFYINVGICSLIKDNQSVNFDYRGNNKTVTVDLTKAYAGENEGYAPDTYCGKYFGCIHYKKSMQTKQTNIEWIHNIFLPALFVFDKEETDFEIQKTINNAIGWANSLLYYKINPDPKDLEDMQNYLKEIQGKYNG